MNSKKIVSKKDSEYFFTGVYNTYMRDEWNVGRLLSSSAIFGLDGPMWQRNTIASPNIVSRPSTWRPLLGILHIPRYFVMVIMSFETNSWDLLIHVCQGCCTSSWPLFTKKTPSYRCRDSYYEPETIVKPSEVYMTIPIPVALRSFSE